MLVLRLTGIRVWRLPAHILLHEVGLRVPHPHLPHELFWLLLFDSVDRYFPISIIHFQLRHHPPHKLYSSIRAENDQCCLVRPERYFGVVASRQELIILKLQFFAFQILLIRKRCEILPASCPRSRSRTCLCLVGFEEEAEAHDILNWSVGFCSFVGSLWLVALTGSGQLVRGLGVDL